MRTVHQRRSIRQEKDAADFYGGKRTPGSGNGWVRKGDVRTDNLMIELKTTTKSSYPLSSRELRELWDQAVLDGRMPVFEIEYANDGVTCVVLDKDDYIRIMMEVTSEGDTG